MKIYLVLAEIDETLSLDDEVIYPSNFIVTIVLFKTRKGKHQSFDLNIEFISKIIMDTKYCGALK